MNSKARRVIAVCIEVLSPEMLESWLQRGWMPHLERLRAEGAWAPLESHPDLSSGAIWPSFFTGVNPGQHGQFFTHMQLQPGTYRIVKKYADDVPFAPFWQELDRAGKSSAILDVPQTRPVEPFRGMHIAGWGGEYPAWPRSSSPAPLIAEVARRFGNHPLVDQYRVAMRPKDMAAFRQLKEELVHGARTKAELSRWIFEQGPHDFFLTVFAETHWALHLLWDALDETHPLHDPAIRVLGEDVFRELALILDQTIGRLREAGPDAAFLVFSLSGMGPNYGGGHILPEVLRRLGLGPEPAAMDSDAGPPSAPSHRDLKQTVQDWIPQRLIEAGKDIVPPRVWDRWTRRLLFPAGPLAKSRAFCVPNDYSGAIRVNLKGREPHGLVSAGEELNSLLAEIRDALMALEHPESNRPVVRDVVRTIDRFSGPNAAALPDLLVLWASESPITRVRSARVGTIHRVSPEQRTGAHRPQGFLIAAGPRVARGTRLGRVALLDLAPTVLNLLGVNLPAHLEGRPVPGLGALKQTGAP